MTDCFALLDDHLATPAEPRSRLFTGYLRTLACHDAAGFAALLGEMEAELAAGRQAVALWSYELGAAMQALPHHPINEPLARVMLFERCELVTAAQVDAWLLQRADGQPAGVANVRASVDETEFTAAIGRIRDYIAAGDTYQVNYTYRLHFDAYGDAVDLYRRLRARQPVPYGALVLAEDGGAVLSFSPELFVAHAGGTLKAKPMKGTARAATPGDADADAINARRALALAADEKNRAENLMIVDLLRNDLGRVAEPGSVQVPHLFDVRRYGQVLQMTSTIRARLRKDATLADAIAALYPCGSITGAPKRRTMQIIDELESTPRGLYTGAIGWFEAPRAGSHTVGDFCLSVPIRTLELQPPAQGLRRGVLGVGAGIVYDSEAASEFAECQLKAAFLTGLGHEFGLFETMHATREGCRHLERHLRRLGASARAFAIPFDEAAIRTQVEQLCATLDPACAHRMKLALDAQGGVVFQHAPLAPLGDEVNVFLADQRSASDDLFLRHKSTRRAVYDAAWQEAERRGGFDMLFFNERDELTEGGRSNVFVKIDGRWVTPPLSAGVLPGVMRAMLLEDPAWDAAERTVSRVELLAAGEIVICNALRGALKATLG
ncbi:aminodeoxychorismate synthase component I [Herbaspirillum sp. LeCh32-8]|uniref:aminodeoxychorismate synthase component I n=1 Tax=Herbaspirillum sp. LeCh32-8 TaxID=2821356 RepID=UPI001AE10A19|nr:aminodeoxychorismate synthase component I [Herbaspirillum sp. LeCh32-8]MBP0597922.1 aminodeoxychorismate synthase component I [Herbaspirillum sp. LeCh32-8]